MGPHVEGAISVVVGEVPGRAGLTAEPYRRPWAP